MRKRINCLHKETPDKSLGRYTVESTGKAVEVDINKNFVIQYSWFEREWKDLVYLTEEVVDYVFDCIERNYYGDYKFRILKG